MLETFPGGSLSQGVAASRFWTRTAWCRRWPNCASSCAGQCNVLIYFVSRVKLVAASEKDAKMEAFTRGGGKAVTVGVAKRNV